MIIALLLSASAVHAQELHHSVFTSGSESHTGNGLRLSGSVTQAAIGYTESQQIEFGVGFWYLISARKTGTDAAGPPNAARFTLGQNYPNPVRSVTYVPIQLERRTDVQLVLYNLRGQKLATLYAGSLGPGHHEVQFSPIGLAPGSYIYALQGEDAIQERQMIITK